MNESEEFLMDPWVRHLLGEYERCGLGDVAKGEIKEVLKRTRKRSLTTAGIEKAVNQAKGLAKRYDKPVCYYLKMSLEKGWISKWVESFSSITRS